MSNLYEYSAVAQRAIEAANETIDRESGRHNVVTAKGSRDFATQVDFLVEDRVQEVLAELTPTIPLLGEERGTRGGHTGSPFEWVLDPIDGTINFAHQSPLFGVSLALLQHGKPVVGIVDAPLAGERFSAVAGQGALCNGKPLAVSNIKEARSALVSIGDFAVGEDAEVKNRERFVLMQRLIPQVLRVRMLGSAALDLCWLAAGRLDATVILSTNIWDVAAGAIIASEAGATVRGRQGEQFTQDSNAIVASGPSIHPTIQELITLASMPTQSA